LKRIESLIGTNATHLPSWLTAGNIVLCGVAVALLLCAGSSAFVWWERRGALDEAQQDAAVLARAFENESARSVTTSNVVANALADELTQHGLQHPERLDASLQQTIASLPFIRSVSVVADSGAVLVSSNADNLHKRIDLAALGESGGSRESQLAIGLPVNGRDLGSSDLTRGAHAYHARLPVGFVPLSRPVTFDGGATGRIVVALNADYLSNLFRLMLTNPDHAAALLTFGGTVIASSDGTHGARSADPARRATLAQWLDGPEQGAFVGAGLDGQAGVVAFRASHAWPLVTVVEYPLDTELNAWRRLAAWTGALTALALTGCLLICVAALKSLRKHVSTMTALDGLMREIANAESRRSALFESSIDGIVAFDQHGVVVECNPAAERIFGYRAADLIGQPSVRLLSDAIVAQAAARQRIEVSACRADGESFPAEVSVVPADANQTHLVLCTVRDLSESQRAAREHARLLEKYRDSSSDLRGLKAALDKHAIVSILSPQGKILYANPMLASISGYTRDELTGASYRLLRPDDYDDSLETDTLLDLIAQGQPWAGQLTHRKRDGSLFWAASTLVPITEAAHDVRHAFLIQTDVTRQIAGEKALADAHRAELELGAGIQRGLLIHELPPSVMDCLTASFNLASRGINGDLFDLIPLNDHCFDILVGDAMGKGVPAALLGAGLKLQFARSLAELLTRERAAGASAEALPSPADIVSHVRRAMHEHLEALESFVTVCYLRIDRQRGTLTWVGCGHEETMLVRAGNEPSFLPNQHPPLGVVADDEIVEFTVPLLAGDTMVLYSDGLADAVSPSGERFGLARMTLALAGLLRTHRRPGMIVHRFRETLLAHAANGSVADDMTMVVLQLPDQPTQIYRNRFEMPRALDALRPLRAFVAGSAEAAGFPAEAAEALTLAVVELATNVVRHDASPGGSPIEVIFSATAEAATLEVLYEGRPFAPPRNLNPDFSGHSEGGFGLYIIQASCDDVVYEHTGEVNRVTLTKRRAPPAAGQIAPSRAAS
jgi:phosphoserine phosphatase RsbU/P